MASTPEFRLAFVARLKQACDESKLVPQPGMGRQQFIVERLHVSPEAVSKWFKGTAMPRPDKLGELAELLGCDTAWLAYGLMPEMDRMQRRVHLRESEGAVQLVLGMIMLAGGHCAIPRDGDPRREYVDFYATMHGTMYPVHVALARETSPDEFEVILPKEFNDTCSVAVIPIGAGNYVFVDMPVALIEKHKTRKSGAFMVSMMRSDGKHFVTNDTTWPRIKTFDRLW